MIRVLAICLTLLSGPAVAMTSADAQLRHFATCTGKLSAKMEWQWMFDGNGSDLTKAQRAAMISLLEATMTPDQGRDVLNWRVDAKVAHAALLTRASFATDPAEAAWALDLAQQQEAACTSLLLG